MQNKRLFTTKIDFAAVDKPPIFLGTVKQLDGVTLKITPLSGRNPMTMIGVTPKLYAKKPNGEFVYQDVDIDVDLSTSQMSIQCKNFIFSDVGTVEMEIELYDDDNYLITSPTFEIDVAQKLNQIGMEDLKEGVHISLLEELMDYVAESKDYVERFKDLLSEFGDDDTIMLENLIVVKTMLETLSSEVDRLENTITQAQEYEFEMANQEIARVAAEEKRVGAEALRVQVETNRVNEEAKRRTTEQARVSAEEIRVQNEAERVQNEEGRKIEEEKRISMYNVHLNDELRREQKHTEMVNTFDTKVGEVNTFVDTKKEEIDSFVSTKTEEVEEFVDLKTNQVNNFITTKTNEVDRFVATKEQEVENAINAIPPKSELIGAKGDKGDKGDTPSITHLETSINNKINEVETRFNALTSSQQQDAEVIDARDGETSLKARLDRDIEKAKQVYVNVEGSNVSTDSSVGYAKDVEILGNTIQDASNLADIRSVGDKVEGQELYEIPVLSVGKNLFNLTNQEVTSNRIRPKFNEITIKQTTLKNLTNKTIIVTIHKEGVYVREHRVVSGSSITINLTNGENYKQLECLFSDGWSANDIFPTNGITITSGTVATPYEPYQEDKLTILSPVQLEKVGDVADRIIEKDGVWGVEKNVVTTMLTSNIMWSRRTNAQGITVFVTPDILSIGHSNRRIICDALVVNEGGNQDAINKYGEILAHKDVNYSQHLYISKDFTTLDEFKEWLDKNPTHIKYGTETEPQFIPLPHDQQIKLRTFANKTNISFGCEIEGTIKAQVPKSLGATVNTHTEQISNLNKELDRVKKLEESTVSTVTTESDFTTVEATSNGYFEDVKLEGKTLVNLLPKIKFTPSYGGNKHISDYPFNFKNANLVSNKLYTICIYGDISILQGHVIVTNVDGKDMVINLNSNGTALFKFVSELGSSPISKLHIYGKNNTTELTETYLNSLSVSLLEGDHTQNPPSYFEGLKSVGDGVDEIVVSSVGENLFDRDTCKYNTFTLGNGEESPNSNYVTSDFIKVNGNTSYYVEGLPVVVAYDSNKNFIKYIRNVSISDTFTTDFNCAYVKIRNWDILSSIELQKEVVNSAYLIQGTTPKPYTPHQADKKRLLYYNNETQAWEKPILRQWDSIEKHADGKYYYHKRSGEVVLNGSEIWGIGNSSNDTTLLMYAKPSEVPKSYTWGICDKFNFQTTNNESIRNTEYIYVDTDINIRINKSRLSTQDVQGFKQWLQANNVTVVYQLAEEKVYECTNIDLITYSGETNYVVESGAIVPRTTLKVHNNISNVVSLLQKKVSLLESNIKASQEVQDMMILETDMRMLDMELALMEFVPMTLNLGGSDMLRSATYFNFLKNHIVNETYEKEYLENVMNKYLATGRINQDEYDELYKMLYPPVYDIELPIEY